MAEAPVSAAGMATAPLLDRLRAEITGGRYRPGSPLSEITLADTFGVSRTPVREALKQLQVEGLVEVKPRVGTFVREPSRREVVELFQLKEVLEGLAARLLAARGRVPEVDQLRANIEQSRQAAKVGDTERHADLVRQFHSTLVDGADSTKLSAQYTTLMNQLTYHQLVVRTLQHPGRPTLSQSEHEFVLDRIVEKDEFGAETAMRDHVRASMRESMADPRSFGDLTPPAAS